MITELNIIFSDIGNLKEPDINCPDISYIEVDSWFDQIQLTNKPDSLQKILSYLEQTNQYNLASKKRLYLLDKLNTPVISLIGNLKSNFLNTLMPLSTKNNQQVDLCLAVYRQIICAYSIILREQLASKDKSWLLHKSLDIKISLSIQRLVRYLSQIILSEFEVYRQSNNNSWEKLYSLFAFSEKNNFSTIFITDPIINKQTTIKITFLQILLLALSDPYHFNQQQIYYIYKHLANWAKLVDVIMSKTTNKAAYSQINLSNDFMPVFSPRGNPAVQQKNLFINTQKLSLDALNNNSKLDNVFLSAKIKARLLKKLKTSWSVHIDRTYERNEYYCELKAVIGLDHVHYVLNNYQQPDWSKKAEYISKNSLFDKLDWDQAGDNTTFKSLNKANSNNLNSIESFVTENESLNGLSLVWTKNYPLKLKIGEIIALSHEKKEQPENWFIGLIRSIQHFHQQPLKIGVQLLCPSGAVPVAIKQKNQFNFHQGILLPEFNLSNQASSEPESVLVDALTFNPMDKVDIESCNYTQQYKAFHINALLLKETEGTQLYMRFLYSKK